MGTVGYEGRGFFFGTISSLDFQLESIYLGLGLLKLFCMHTQDQREKER